MSSTNRYIRITIIAGELDAKPLVGQYLCDCHDYRWLGLWEVLWRLRRGDIEYCVVSNNPKFSLADAAMLADAAHKGNLRAIALNDIAAVATRKNGEK